MIKRLTCWAIILILFFGVTFVDYSCNRKPIKEATKLSVYTDIYGYEETIRDKCNNKWKDHEDYNFVFEKAESPEKADVIFSSDYSKLDLKKEYKTICYSPMIVVLKKQKVIRKYADKGLLKAKGKIDLYEEDKIEINFNKLVNAVIDGKKWKYFGGSNTKIKVYCPKQDTQDGKLFYQFLLITINKGIYPSDEDSIVKCKEKADQFLNSSSVQQVDIIDRLSKVDDINNDVYIMPESDHCQSASFNERFYVAYPTETVIKEVYCQANTPSGEMVAGELLYKSYFFSNTLYEDLTSNMFYRSSEEKDLIDDLEDMDEKETNIKKSFNYVEIPKEVWTSVIAE